MSTFSLYSTVFQNITVSRFSFCQTVFSASMQSFIVSGPLSSSLTHFLSDFIWLYVLNTIHVSNLYSFWHVLLGLQTLGCLLDTSTWIPNRPLKLTWVDFLANYFTYSFRHLCWWKFQPSAAHTKIIGDIFD